MCSSWTCGVWQRLAASGRVTVALPVPAGRGIEGPVSMDGWGDSRDANENHGPPVARSAFAVRLERGTSMMACRILVCDGRVLGGQRVTATDSPFVCTGGRRSQLGRLIGCKWAFCRVA